MHRLLCGLSFFVQVAAGKMPQYHCYDFVLLQKISDKLQRLGCEPLAGRSCVKPEAWNSQAAMALTFVDEQLSLPNGNIGAVASTRILVVSYCA